MNTSQTWPAEMTRYKDSYSFD